MSIKKVNNRKTYSNILALILGGGAGTRLYPLTQQRAKPAVPIAGKYRLIDIPISNCINSEVNYIAVLTQFLTVSLHRHISRTYNFDNFSKGWVQIWAAEQTLAGAEWYQGNADAVRKQINEIESARCAYTMILSGDHLYRMDYRELADFHWSHDADVTIAVQPVKKEEASRFGILKTEKDDRISAFAEKPKDPKLLKSLVSSDDPDQPYLCSMGIYFFKTDVLIELLQENSQEDFGKHIIPYAIETKNTFGYRFDGYWEDIGTMRSFYDTNLQLAAKDPNINFFDPNTPIYTRSRFLPGTTVENCTIQKALIADGCRIEDSVIRNSVIGLRSLIGTGSYISRSIIMGLDYYDSPDIQPEGTPPLGVGDGSQITGAILDKNVRVGRNVVIREFPRGTEIDHELYYVRDGIVVIPKGAILPDGTRIEPEEAKPSTDIEEKPAV
ncbi:MAG TPA: glucose-1-phosphate adenylyltransferase [Chloroflexi bacterium]|nr:glucose-1-phosphate adenylyltransferase [Chloroflexota bacterium]